MSVLPLFFSAEAPGKNQEFDISRLQIHILAHRHDPLGPNLVGTSLAPVLLPVLLVHFLSVAEGSSGERRAREEEGAGGRRGCGRGSQLRHHAAASLPAEMSALQGLSQADGAWWDQGRAAEEGLHGHRRPVCEYNP